MDKSAHKKIIGGIETEEHFEARIFFLLNVFSDLISCERIFNSFNGMPGGGISSLGIPEKSSGHWDPL